jgi:hypothetical protein
MGRLSLPIYFWLIEARGLKTNSGKIDGTGVAKVVDLDGEM